jgi:hypothetical protein
MRRAGHYGSRGCRFESCRARVWLRQNTGPYLPGQGPVCCPEPGAGCRPCLRNSGNRCNPDRTVQRAPAVPGPTKGCPSAHTGGGTSCRRLGSTVWGCRTSAGDRSVEYCCARICARVGGSCRTARHPLASGISSTAEETGVAACPHLPTAIRSFSLSVTDRDIRSISSGRQRNLTASTWRPTTPPSRTKPAAGRAYGSCSAATLGQSTTTPRRSTDSLEHFTTRALKHPMRWRSYVDTCGTATP